jgi:predicted permease
MSELLSKLAPVLITFFLGIILKKGGILNKNDGDLLLKIVFYLTLPALIVLSVSAIQISRDLIFLPFIALATIVLTFLFFLSAGRFFAGERRVKGTAAIGAMIMNVGFLYPFIIAAYGHSGFARAVIFDFGNGLMVVTFVYYIACRHGDPANHPIKIFKKLCASPPLWALAAALTLNISNLALPLFIKAALESIGNVTIPLIMLSLGVYFTPALVRYPLLIFVLVIRTAGGLGCGLLFAELFDLQGLTRSIAVICAAAPVGYNTLTFSSLAELDVEFAASLVSISIALGILYVPVLILILPPA